MPSLFAPVPFPADDPHAIVSRYPFALLVTNSAEGVHATSLPLVYETDDSRDVLVGHLARRNAHSAALQGDMYALAVFSGPNAYVSSRWYVDMPQVPTWNYVAAQVRGKLTPIDDLEDNRRVLARTIAVMERINESPWTLQDAPEGRVATLLPMIRSFSFRIDRIEGVTRLSQKHGAADRERVAGHLAAQDDGDANEIARMMAALRLS